MIRKILKSVKEELNSKFVTMGLSETKAKEAIRLGADIIETKLSEQLSGANTQGLMKLFTSTQPLDQTQLVQNMMIEYRVRMVNKLHFSEYDAKQIAAFIIPFIMSKLSHKVTSGGEETLRTFTRANNPLDFFMALRGNFIKAFAL